MKTSSLSSNANEAAKIASLEQQTLDEARLRRDVVTAELSLDRVTEDLEHFRAHRLEQGSGEDVTIQVKELLPIIDSLDAAIESKTKDVEALRQTIVEACQNLLDLLFQRGIEVERPVGETYRPDRHCLHAMDCDPTKLENTVLKVIERGYRRGGKVFRPAKVVVNVLDQTRVGDGS